VHVSGAPATAVLALDVDDLDLAAHRAGQLRWDTTTSALLAELVDGRRSGPVFLADRRPGPGRPRPQADLCPETGRGRLSYPRAEYLFKRASGGATLRSLQIGQPRSSQNGRRLSSVSAASSGAVTATITAPATDSGRR
jgi:hypothetical protein